MGPENDVRRKVLAAVVSSKGERFLGGLKQREERL